MPSSTSEPGLTRSLEDYLETIYELQRDRQVARVRDIAEARGVKAGSVSPALRRLYRLGLVDYARRERIGLTPRGERLARRIYARHRLLEQLFQDVLLLPPADAEPVACAMEHSLSPAAMDRLARFLEFLEVRSEGSELLASFHAWLDRTSEEHPPTELPRRPTLGRLRGGQRARVLRVLGYGEQRRRLLDMGLLRDAEIEVLAPAGAEGPLRARLHGHVLELTAEQAAAVRVEPMD
jgi:DtxR family Mn-dependent transcriptional regulator